MECDLCGGDGDVLDQDTDMDQVVLRFYCFNEDCPGQEGRYYTYKRQS